MSTSVGSGLMSKQRAQKPHLLRGSGGVAGEVADLRHDVNDELEPMAAIAVVEFTNPAAAGAELLKAATATVAAPVVLTKADLLSGGLTTLANEPRNLTFTTGGSTPSDAPATATITGKGPNGVPQTETVTLAQTATVATGTKLWTDIEKIEYPPADGTDATVSIGIGSAMYLPKKPKERAGLAVIIREVAAGAAVTTGTLNAAESSYTPATAPNGTNDYAVYYEYDPTV
jgi:hypothetical protein